MTGSIFTISLFQAETTQTVLWAILISFAFAVLLAAVALISPLVNNRSLVEANRTSWKMSSEQINSLTLKVEQLEHHNTLLMKQNFELRNENGQNKLNLEAAYEHITYLERQIRDYENPDS